MPQPRPSWPSLRLLMTCMAPSIISRGPSPPSATGLTCLWHVLIPCWIHVTAPWFPPGVPIQPAINNATTKNAGTTVDKSAPNAMWTANPPPIDMTYPSEGDTPFLHDAHLAGIVGDPIVTSQGGYQQMYDLNQNGAPMATAQLPLHGWTANRDNNPHPASVHTPELCGDELSHTADPSCPRATWIVNATPGNLVPVALTSHHCHMRHTTPVTMVPLAPPCCSFRTAAILTSLQ